MSDPRLNDPNHGDSLLKDPRGPRGDKTWTWIAGIAVLVLIGFIMAAGWNSDTNTASNPTTPATTTGSAPSTTGQAPPARTTPPAATPAPTTPPASAPAPSGN